MLHGSEILQYMIIYHYFYMGAHRSSLVCDTKSRCINLIATASFFSIQYLGGCDPSKLINTPVAFNGGILSGTWCKGYCSNPFSVAEMVNKTSLNQIFRSWLHELYTEKYVNLMYIAGSIDIKSSTTAMSFLVFFLGNSAASV